MIGNTISWKRPDKEIELCSAALRISHSKFITKMIIRSYSAADVGDMVSLMSDLGYPSSSDDLTARIQKMPPDLYHTLVAEVSGEVVGFIGLLILPLYDNDKSLGWILALSVGSRHRRQGIGRSLIHAAEGFFRERGVTDIRLSSGIDRSDAHHFYEALGYSKTGYRFKKRIE